MKIRVQSIHFTADSKLLDFIQEKVDKLVHFYDQIISGEVFLKLDKSNDTQNKIVQLLINYWDKPNVFVVGDDDQSIYRFQGANVENMLDFAGKYKDDLKTVVLTNNYRSIQSILDISKTLINKNNDRLVKQIDGLSKELIAANEKINHLTE